MTFQQISYVVEIARHGSLSKVAKTLFITQPYLSQILRDLEAELGIRIFTRSNRGVQLTDDGREFLSYAQPLLEQQKKILEMYQSQQVHPSYYFSVSLQRFPFVVEAFVQFYRQKMEEKFEIHLREVGMYRVLNDVAEKRSVLGIIYISAASEGFLKKYLAGKGLEFVEIAAVTPCVFFGEHHPMARKKEIYLHEMQEYPYITFEEDAFVSLDFSEEVVLPGLQPGQKRIFIEDRGTMTDLLRQTDAYSIGSGILPPEYGGDGHASRPIADQAGKARIGYVKPAASVLDSDMLAFIDYIGQHIPPRPWE